MDQPKSFPEKLPLSSEDLIKTLDAVFPHRCIKPGDDLHMALSYSGARELIDCLMKKLEDDRREEPAREEKWYDEDHVLKDYVEGDW